MLYQPSLLSNSHVRVFAKAIIILFVLVVVIHQFVLFIMPNLTVQNNSITNIESGTVNLPNNTLDFGRIAQGQSNSIYYSLSQSDGEYQYVITLENGLSYQGACGYVTQNEINKRVIITITDEGKIVCSSL